jgi:xylulokinase
VVNILTSAPLLAGLDVGTTNIKALIAEPDGTVVSIASLPTPTHHPKPGWAYYEPSEIWSSVCDVLSIATSAVEEPARIAGIAVASVGETAYPVDKDGKTVHHGIAWFDTRAKAQADWLAKHIGADRIYKSCRMSIQPIYGLCKLLWMRDNEPDALARTTSWLNTADFIAFKLSGERATDPSLASRALLFDVDKYAWATDILVDCGLSPDLLAPLKRSGTAIGKVLPNVAKITGMPDTAVVATGGHDHVCGALGVGVADPDTVLNSLGTAEAQFIPIDKPLMKPEVAAQGYSVGGHVARDRYYAIGGLYSSGGSVDWVKSILGSLDHAELLQMASKVPPGSQGVCFLPHLRIANPPFGDAPSRGAFVGLTGDVDQGTLYRAVLEGIAFEAKLCLDGLLSYAGLTDVDRIVAIGGSTRNDLLMRIKASVYGRPLTISETEEGVALGAAILAGLGAGVYRDMEDAGSTVVQKTRIVEPEHELMQAYTESFITYKHVYPSLKDLNARIDREN